MKAIILAAGRGSRMGSMTSDLPKCRTVLFGKELIRWQLDSLKGSGINDISIVRGYLASTFKFNLKYFDNPRWAATNMVVSLCSADRWLNNDTCIVSYSDIVYSSDAVKKLQNTKGDIVITYDPEWRKLWELRFEDPLSDAETFQLDGNRVIEIGHSTTKISDIQGQYMGLIKFTPKGWAETLEYLKTLNQNQIDKLDITKLLQGLIKSKIVINATAIEDEWFEVDSESDLNAYQSAIDIKNIWKT